LGAREHASQPRVLGARYAQRAGESLEHRFNLMMAGPPVPYSDMNVGARPDREPFKEILNELGLEVADSRRADLEIDNRPRPAAEVNRGNSERFIHRHDEVPRAIDAPSTAERFGNGLPEGDAEVFDRVVLVDVEIAVGVDCQVEDAVPRHQLEHV